MFARWPILSLLFFAASAPAAPSPRRPVVEIVFCIDTTASAPATLNALVRCLRPVCDALRQGAPRPLVRVGLVAYRDRGEEYVTRLFPLRDDLAAVEADLRQLTAAGGGDVPEHVNEALRVAVQHSGQRDPAALRLVFVIGDAPPHMDYKDDTRYPVTCEKAKARGIIVNTVTVGTDRDCLEHFAAMARLTGGRHATVPAKPVADDLSRVILDAIRAQSAGKIRY